MNNQTFIRDKVHLYFWQDELNCAVTAMKILAERHGIEINEQVYDAAVGLNGQGQYGAQCGLVTAAAMFIGILGKHMDLCEKNIHRHCHAVTDRFEKTFASLERRLLRPEGFKDSNPSHLCERLAANAVILIDDYITNM